MAGWGRVAGVVLLIGPVGSALAGEQPLYQPAPDWAQATTLPDAAPGGGLQVLDIEQRVDGATVWNYTDTVIKLNTPEELAQNSNVTVGWAPDKGDLIVHELSIIRDGQVIDALAGGQKFTVLRREEALEQRELTGILSANLPVEGLRVGDMLRLRMSITNKDDALGGRAQLAVPLIAEPARIGSGSYRLSWRADDKLQWKSFANGVTLKPVRKGAYFELPVTLPIAKQAEMPSDAPMRFRSPPLIEASTFSGWSDVSKVMAPLYATAGTIADDSPLAAEVAAIKAATTDPLERAAKALQLVQDKVRYLAVGMDGGNYVPQTPAKTWDVRYGDCKAKTLLLLAMLHAMDIDAEPVLAHAQLGDAVASRLPTALAFNHVIVKATIGGEPLWLDGTGLGTRLADIRDTPAFGYVLPVRAEGAELEKIALRRPARPTIDLALDADESTSIDLPSVIKVDMVVRGQLASLLTLSTAQLGPKEQEDMLNGLLQNFVGQAQFDKLEAKPDAADGSVTITARGVFGSGWEREDNRSERWLSRVGNLIEFSPDRARASWANIPVATGAPDYAHYRLRVRLPDGGRDYKIEGEGALDARLAGVDVKRSVTMADGYVVVDEVLASSGVEIAPTDVAAERDRVATVISQTPRLVAPEDARRRWNLKGAPSTSQLDAVRSIYAVNAAKADEENVSALISEASFQRGIGDYKGAEQTLTRQIALQPSEDAYLSRSGVRKELGNIAGALADAEEARKLDPSSLGAIGAVAMLTAEKGDVAAATRMFDDRIALGGKSKSDLRLAKAAMVGEFGDPKAAIDELDALVATKPGSPDLLNARCWVKASREVAVDSALKDCTSAMELADSTAHILDSRALVWLRLGRNDDALRDLDAALLQVPSLASSRFLRAIVYQRLGRATDAAADLAIARQLSPSTERDYARFGLKP